MSSNTHKSPSKSARRKPSILKRPPKNVTLSWKTIQKLRAFGDYKVSQGDQRPDRSWMLEQGAELFCSAMVDKYPDLGPIFEDIEMRYQRAAGILEPDLVHGKGSPLNGSVEPASGEASSWRSQSSTSETSRNPNREKLQEPG